MINPSEIPASLPRPEAQSSGRDRTSSPAGLALAIAWLVVPAVQYYGTATRTEYQLRETEILSPTAEWDLTPFYLLLVLSTIAYWLLSAFRTRDRLSAKSASVAEAGDAA